MKSRVFARTAVRKSNDNNQTDEEEERINKMQNGILCFVLHTFRWRIDRWTAYSNCRICLDYIFFFRFYFCHFEQLWKIFYIFFIMGRPKGKKLV